MKEEGCFAESARNDMVDVDEAIFFLDIYAILYIQNVGNGEPPSIRYVRQFLWIGLQRKGIPKQHRRMR
jgi:hypothetical protein